MAETAFPSEREFQILDILWQRGEATVREVHEILHDQFGIVQNTVQTFLRTMTEKGLVAFRKEGRTFVYVAKVKREDTKRRLLGRVLDHAFEGAIDQLVASAVALRPPTDDELSRLRDLLAELSELSETRS